MPSATEPDQLQTDVMRFMAIIGFCLVAVFALVRQQNAELPHNPDRVATRSTTDAREVAPPISPPAAATQASPARSAKRLTSPALSTDISPAPAATVPEVTDVSNKAARFEPPPASAPPSPSGAQPRTTQSPADAPGHQADTPLQLQFSSPADFLHLVATGGVALFAEVDGRWMQFTAAFRWRTVRAPGEIYELLPDSLPEPAQPPARTTGRIGVALPPDTKRQLADYAAQLSSGVLSIDRSGAITHQPTHEGP